MSGPILVFGAGGMVGREIARLAGLRAIPMVGVAHQEADITDADAIARAIERARPRLIVNAAAYTAVDRAESEPEAALAGNALGPGVLAAAAERCGAPLVHLSTDYVFDGAKPSPYVESDPVCPVSVYGRTKAQGEERVREVGARHVILRTAWVYGAFGANFLKTMVRLARERDELRVVADQQGCPTCASDIAEAVLAVDRSLEAGAQAFGLYHFAGTGETSWHGFAEAIVAAQAQWSGRRPAVTAIATADYPTPARRPPNSRLDSSLFAATFGYKAADWRARTNETVRELCAPESGAAQ